MCVRDQGLTEKASIVALGEAKVNSLSKAQPKLNGQIHMSTNKSAYTEVMTFGWCCYTVCRNVRSVHMFTLLRDCL